MEKKKYKCLIVDDEPVAIRILKSHLSHFSAFELVAGCTNPIEALSFLQKGDIDLVFLDIEMPVLTGLELIKTLSVPPCIIFTTAHRNFAVEAFEIEALDYLLKPITLERFAKSVNRFIELKKQPEPEGGKDDAGVIIIKSDKKNHRLKITDIVYIESLADYVVVHLDSEKFVTKERISHLEEKLPSSQFLRVHRGYIVNLEQITSFYGYTLELGKTKIPVGRNYKEQLDVILK
ncbi:MAG: response regulator transcription factor [Prolixibacteraceae bacterium]|nr:response regulator transcription factor [Prolixibacteraceae bacterium]